MVSEAGVGFLDVGCGAQPLHPHDSRVRTNDASGGPNPGLLASTFLYGALDWSNSCAWEQQAGHRTIRNMQTQRCSSRVRACMRAGFPGTMLSGFSSATFQSWAPAFYARLAAHAQRACASIGCAEPCKTWR